MSTYAGRMIHPLNIESLLGTPFDMSIDKYFYTSFRNTMEEICVGQFEF